MKAMLIALLLLMFAKSLKIPHLDFEWPFTQEQLTCLVDNAFYEAQTEGKLGRLLVTHVVLNRAPHGDFCKEVYRHKQFSWTLLKVKPIPKKVRLSIEKEVLGLFYGFESIPEQFWGMTHYHTHQVKPIWRKSCKEKISHKNHIFYRGCK